MIQKLFEKSLTPGGYLVQKKLQLKKTASLWNDAEWKQDVVAYIGHVIDFFPRLINFELLK